MDWTTPLVTVALLALFTAIQAWISRGRIDVLEARMEKRFEQLSAEIAQIRSDLLQVVLSLSPRRETG